MERLLWLDLEMTGLDPAKQRIIETAAIITDFEFKEVAKYSAVIYQPEEVLKNAEPWCHQNLQQLFGEVRMSKVTSDEAERELISLANKHFHQGRNKVVLAGNSIHHDRKFIAKYWPSFESMLHYRMLDVSSFKLLIEGKGLGMYSKANKHRALADVRESIQELKWAIKTLARKDLQFWHAIL